MSTQTAPALEGLRIAQADAETAPEDLVQGDYYAALQEQANQAVGSVYGVSITPISQASVGGFNYIWENANLDFNLGTWSYLNSRVVPSVQPAAKLTDPLSTGWDKLLQIVAFDYSPADKEAINRAQTAANAQATSVVSQYTSAYGPITKEMMQQAKVSTPIDYIIQYVVAQRWSCTASQGEPPLSLQQLQQARNLQTLLPCMPASGANMLSGISLYLNTLSAVLPLQQLSMNANWLLGVLKNNTQFPSSANGGITTVDPNNGETATHVAYAVNAAVAAIQNDLNNLSRKFGVHFEASQLSQSTLSVSVQGSGGLSVPLGWFFSLGGSGGAAFDLYSFKGTQSAVSIDMQFAGYSFIPVRVQQFQTDTLTGWFDAQVLTQAVENTGKDVTGYRFIKDPGYDFTAEGDFGMLSGVLVSNFPTISIDYMTGNYEEFMQSFQQGSSWDVRFFGIKLGSFSERLYEATVTKNSTSGGFTVTFTPSQEVLSVPDLQKQAYVIGGSLVFPGTGIV